MQSGTPRQLRPWNSPWLALPVLAVVVTLFTSPMFATPDGFTSGDTYRSHDWLIAATHEALFRDTVLRHQQVPLRSHLVGGGYPVIGHPSDGSYSPFILTSLFLGERIGLKLNLIVCLFLGSLGVFLLSREILRVPGLGPLFASLAFAVAGWHPSRTLVGYYEASFYLLFPLMLHLVLVAGRRYTNFVLGVVVSSACLMQVLGGAAAFGMWAAAHLLLGARASEHRWPRPVRGMAMLVFMLGVAVALGAVKFVPAVDLMGRGAMDRMPEPLLRDLPSGGVAQFAYKRTFDYYTAYRDPGTTNHLDYFYYSPGSLLECLVTPVSLKGEYEKQPEGDLRALKPEYPFINVGWMVVGLGVLGLLLRRFRSRSSAWLFLLAVVITSGWHSPVDLFRLLAYLPLVNEMARAMQYFNFFIYVELVLLAGAAFAWMASKLPREWMRLALFGLCLAGLIPTALENAARYQKAFSVPAPRVERVKDFHQVKLRNGFLREQISVGYGNTYLNVRKGVGTVVWDSNIKMLESAVPRYFVHDDGVKAPNPLYRGEAWFLEPQNEVVQVSITPNKIRASVKLATPGVLYINQNYDDDWMIDGGELIRDEGLIRVKLGKGAHEITLDYEPGAFYRGLGISLGGGLFILVLGLFRRRLWRPRPAAMSGEGAP